MMKMYHGPVWDMGIFVCPDDHCLPLLDLYEKTNEKRDTTDYTNRPMKKGDTSDYTPRM